MSISSTTMYAKRDINGLHFAEPIEGMILHAKETALQAQNLVTKKTTRVASPTINQQDYYIFVAPVRPIYYVQPVYPMVGRVTYMPFGSVFGHTTIIQNTTIVNTPTRIASNNGKLDSPERVLIGLIGTITVGICSYLAGQQYQHMTAAHQERSDIKKNIKLIDVAQTDFNARARRQNVHLKNVREILTLEKGIFGRIQGDSLVKTALLVGFVAAGAFAVAAALTALSSLAVTAAVVGLVAGSVSLFYLGFNNVKEANAKAAEKMQDLIYDLSMKAEDYGFDTVEKSDAFNQVEQQVNKQMRSEDEIREKIQESISKLNNLTQNLDTSKS